LATSNLGVSNEDSGREIFARDGWLVRRVRRLQLIRRDHDKIDKYAGHDHVVRPQRSSDS
jgi:hypothetical protein